MRTFHLTSFPKGKWEIPARKIQLNGKEALRIRANSRTARKLRRAGAELVRP